MIPSDGGDAGEPRGVGWRMWATIWVVATALALFLAGQIYVDNLYGGGPITWWDSVRLALADWYAWALLAPVVFEVSRRVPLQRDRWLRALTVHLTLGVLLTAGKLVVEAWVVGMVFGARSQSSLKIYVNVLIYGAVVVIAHSVNAYRSLRERERRATDLEAQLAQARLQALRSQLHPHFLFNALNTVSSLMHRDVEGADLMLERVAGLLRRTLDTSSGPEVSLREELDLLREYLAIEEVRLEERLRVSWRIEPETRSLAVPIFLLQPLVENAIRYGIAPRSEGGALEIAARRSGTTLVIEVSDDGPGFRQLPPQEGIGLSSTRRRLEELYGSEGEVTFDESDRGARVRVSFTARSAPETVSRSPEPATSVRTGEEVPA